jgi:hypothetical protein
MNVHKNAYSGGIKKRIGRSDLKGSGVSRAKAGACTPKCLPAVAGVTPACATYLRPPKHGLRVGGSRSGEDRARRPDFLRRRTNFIKFLLT